MIYKQDISGCFTEKSPIKKEAFELAVSRAIKAKTQLENYQNGTAPVLFAQVLAPTDIKYLTEVAAQIRRNFSSLIIIGTGGSTLNPQSILAIKQHLHKDLKIYFADNLDPLFTQQLLDEIDINKTAFLAISKSGTTLEVLAHVLLFISFLEKNNVTNLGQKFFFISDPGTNVLRDIGKEIGATIIDHHSLVGGRFASFTNVGLLPALIAGLDVNKLINGGKIVVEDFLAQENNYPTQGAALNITAMNAGLPINVFMPYIEALKPFTSWLCQIWAESLGKNGQGSTPIRAAGTLDQHSQLQLYLDGPADKLFNIIGLSDMSAGPVINSRFTKMPDIAYLAGKNFAAINIAAKMATTANISSKFRPVRVISLPKLDEESLGALMMHFTIETILTAQILEVNAFDQPAVESGKALAREILRAN